MATVTIEGLDAVRQLLDQAANAVQAINGAYATVGTNISYAPLVHFGTRAHPIAARNKRALFWPGAQHPVRSVNHPGYKGNPFLTSALSDSAPQVSARMGAALESILGRQAAPSALADALYAAALLVEAAAKQRANVRTGTLRRSITSQVYGTIR